MVKYYINWKATLNVFWKATPRTAWAKLAVNNFNLKLWQNILEMCCNLILKPWRNILKKLYNLNSIPWRNILKIEKCFSPEKLIVGPRELCSRSKMKSDAIALMKSSFYNWFWTILTFHDEILYKLKSDAIALLKSSFYNWFWTILTFHDEIQF